VFADVLPGTFNLDPADIKRKITPKTKAIVPVHLFGQTADMDAIMAIAKEHKLFVIEDNCQAIGGDYTASATATRKSGTIGHIGTTSFFPSKNLGCYGDGGALFTNDDELAKKLRRVCNHGSDVRYYHEVVGVNSRSGLHAGRRPADQAAAPGRVRRRAQHGRSAATTRPSRVSPA
jgi:UDP-2-acetamido-2-deoxy-ribo-hexuluronate aminotransferase